MALRLTNASSSCLASKMCGVRMNNPRLLASRTLPRRRRVWVHTGRGMSPTKPISGWGAVHESTAARMLHSSVETRPCQVFRSWYAQWLCAAFALLWVRINTRWDEINGIRSFWIFIIMNWWHWSSRMHPWCRNQASIWGSQTPLAHVGRDLLG